MVREPRRIEPFHAPPEFLSGGLQATESRLPMGGVVDPALLRRFGQRMTVRGHGVQLARMGYDRIYATQVLATACISGDEALAAMALRLYRAFRGGS